MSHAAPSPSTRRARGPLVTMVIMAVLVVALGPALLARSSADESRPSAYVGRKLVVKPSQAADPSRQMPAGYMNQPARGLVYRGLGRSSRCPGGFLLEGTRGFCTHGPDEPATMHAGPGDVRDVPSTSQLIAAAGELMPQSTSSTAGQIPCYGDGTTGPRVQMVYAVASDRTDRYLSLVDTLPVYAARTNAVFVSSAEETGGTRNVRFVHTSDCRLDVLHVVLSSTGDDTFSNMVTELRNLGLTRTDRKYLVWVDAGVYCGIATVVSDDSPGATNRSNSGPTFARVDAGCWGGTNAVEAHEIAHNLGAVQLSAPHSNGSWHCTDDYDRMCYNDGSGATMQILCPSTSAEALFDCGGGDYYNVNPQAGSYLASHWNLAGSVFLSAVPPDNTSTVSSPSPVPTTTSAGPSPTPTTSPTITSPSPSPTLSSSSPSPSPSPSMVTTTFSGSLNKKQSAREFSLTVAAGPIRSDLQVKRAPSMTLTLLAPDGSTVGTWSGVSVQAVTAPLPAGTYLIRVDGATSGSFIASISHPG